MSEIREALSAAFEQAESAEQAEVASPVVPIERQDSPVDRQDAAPDARQESAPTLADKPATEGRDEKGRFAAKAKAEAAALNAGGPATVKPDAVNNPTAAAAPAHADSIKAPQSWKPDAREKWAALPPEVQREVARREKDTATVLQEASSAKKWATDFQQAVAPYEAMIRAEGSDPIRAAANLFQTAAALRTAPPAHKAQLVAQMVRAYGIPIDALDAALTGQPQQGGQQQGQYQDPRVDQLLRSIEQARNQRSQSVQSQAQQEAESFAAKSEFFEDVREDVADLLEMAARRGVALTLDAAYNRAVQMNPEASKVLRQREEAKSATTAHAATQQARNASSSVRNQPAGPQSAAKPNGIRGALEAAFTAHSGR